MNKIINQLEQGKISANKAVKKINKLSDGKAHFVNITINKFNIKIPLCFTGIWLKIASKSDKYHDFDLKDIDIRPLKKYIKENMKGVTLVEIESAGENVKISFS